MRYYPSPSITPIVPSPIRKDTTGIPSQRNTVRIDTKKTSILPDYVIMELLMTAATVISAATSAAVATTTTSIAAAAVTPA